MSAFVKSAVILIVLAGAVSAIAEDFSASPYATSREEAIGRRAEAFSAMGLPRTLIAQMVSVTRVQGEKVSITRGHRFDLMVWGGPLIRRDVVVMPEAPSLPAEQWEIPFGESIISIFLVSLPDGQHYNWSIEFREATVLVSCPFEQDGNIQPIVAQATS